MKNNSFKEIWNKLKNSKRVIMALHEGPDGDSLGSCVAMKYVLEKFGVGVILISFDNLDETLASLELSKEVDFGKKFEDLNIKDSDIILFLDSSEISHHYYNNKEKTIIRNNFLINIDHHQTNKYYGQLNYVDIKQPSVCSILLDLFKFLKIKFDKKLSTSLLLGVCTDSGFFKHEHSIKALKDALFLIENGANYFEDVINPVLNNQPLKMKKYYSLLINNLKINKEKKFAYSSISYNHIKKLDLNLAEIRLGPNYLADIKEVDFIFTLAEMQNIIKGSFRSSKRINVLLFAKELGGSGHKPAAAFKLNKMPLDKAEKIVINIINKVGIYKYKSENK
jgi:phosphoesterase RecJ-like protein